LVQQTIERGAVDWIEVFKFQFHYELQRIKLEVQGPKPVIIHTRLGAHISLLLSTTNSLALAKSIKNYVTPKLGKRPLLSPLTKTTTQTTKRAKILKNSIPPLELPEILAGSIGVQEIPVATNINLENSNDSMETDETYTKIFQEEEEITNPKIKNKRDIKTGNPIIIPEERNFDINDKLTTVSAKPKTQVAEAAKRTNRPQTITKIHK